ncbi:MAG: tetratricopeptide repeat protein [Candidatus Scalindua sp.]|nr:tetratricopeptide repeat protein [Candidatus Scalindua sp.]
MFKQKKNQIFLCCAEEDTDEVNKIYDGMKARALNVCFDRMDITPKKWETQVEKAINKSQYFVICLSKSAIQNAVDKRHGFQNYRLNKAYDIALKKSDEEPTIVPVIIGNCDHASNFIGGSSQYNLFREFKKELDRLAINLGGNSLSDANARDERSEEEKATEMLMGKATVTYYAGEFQKSLALLENITAIASDIYEVWYNKGVVLGNLDRHDDALSAFDQAINIKPDEHRALYYNKGVSLEALDRLEEAINAFDKAIKIKPDDYESWYCKGIALDNLDRSTEALDAYEKVTVIKPDHEEAWNNKGIILGSLNRFDEALAALDKAVKINPDDHEAWHNKGVVLVNLNCFKEAIEAFDHAIKSKPDVSETWYQKGIVLCKLNRHEEALGALDQATSINPDDYKAWYNIGVSLDSLGRPQEAIKAYDKSTRIKLGDINTEKSSD